MSTRQTEEILSMPLTDGELNALRNLSRKKSGRAVEWIGIADARSLTAYGLAERSQEGWRITTTGEAALERAHSATPSNVVPFAH